jgi:hypothetical protein
MEIGFGFNLGSRRLAGLSQAAEKLKRADPSPAELHPTSAKAALVGGPGSPARDDKKIKDLGAALKRRTNRTTEPGFPAACFKRLLKFLGRLIFVGERLRVSVA